MYLGRNATEVEVRGQGLPETLVRRIGGTKKDSGLLLVKPLL
jgi:hypothetical protein